MRHPAACLQLSLAIFRQARKGRAVFRSTWFLIISFVFLWNSGFIGAQFSLSYAGPLTQLFWRYLALTLLLLLGLGLSRKFVWPGPAPVVIQSIVGILAHAAWLGSCLIAIQGGVDVGIVALVVSLQPLMTGALSGCVTGETTSARIWLGLLIGFAGVVMTVGLRIQSGPPGSGIYYLFPLIAAFCMTAATLFQRRLELMHLRTTLPLWPSLFYQAAASAMVLFPLAWFFEGLDTEWTLEFAGGLAWLIIAVSLGAYSVMWTLIKRIDATRVASLFYLGPPVTMLMAWLAFGDVLHTADIAGLLLVLVGVGLAQEKRATNI